MSVSKGVAVSKHNAARLAALILAATISLVPYATYASSGNGSAVDRTTIAPRVNENSPVGWWFVFKFNAKVFPGCAADVRPVCPFGGDVESKPSSQQYVYASSEDRTLKMGHGCLGDTEADPVGATFANIYNGDYYYVVWNDQFYDDPKISGCSKSCAGPWGHSKGVLAWNSQGEGLILQVTTPSWPGAASQQAARVSSGNTLGCIQQPNNILVSQSFFSVRLTKSDVLAVLQALGNASVVTDQSNPQLVKSGGPPELQQAVKELGKKSNSQTVQRVQLSSHVGLLSKPSGLHVPPWQLVSAMLGQLPLRVASWWINPDAIGSTTSSTTVSCWANDLPKPGPVQIATSGNWQGTTIGLKGGPSPGANHAKVGVSTDSKRPFVIFGDMNQQGVLSDSDCSGHQNGRGGLFFIIQDQELWESVSDLLKGESAPLAH